MFLIKKTALVFYEKNRNFVISRKGLLSKASSVSFETNPFHVSQLRPWPALFCSNSLFFILSLVFFFNDHLYINLVLGFILIRTTLLLWSRDIIREGTFRGCHTSEVEKRMKWSIAWFISSEVLFFFSFFWGFFTFSSSPIQESGNSWPPFMIEPIDAFSVPLLNTLVLLTSGIRLTWAHHSLIEGNFRERISGFLFTSTLGIYFTFLQVMEYRNRTFSFFDSLYGRIFFIATGFHGLHVLIGTSLIIICLYRLVKNQRLANHHIGVETARWYWHFVDVVWLFLFCCIYWWGGN